MTSVCLVFSCVLIAAVSQDEPCGPRLEPMETITLPIWDDEGQPTDTTQTVSVADTDTRKVVADYMLPSEFKVGTFSMLGTIEVVNKTGVTRKIRYRQTVRIGEGYVPFFDSSSPLCWEPEKQRVVVLYEYVLAPNQTESFDIDWSTTLRQENRTADINSDGAVDGLDQGVLMTDWGTTNFRSDLNQDGIVDGTDLGILFSQWSESSSDEVN